MAERKNLDLGETKGKTERDDSFWNRSVVLLKSTVQPQWLEMVHNAKRKPNYGMRGLNGIMEERMLNKIELVGPVVDSYVKHMGNLIYSKLARSKNTGLMSPITIFIPWSIFRHICVLVVGYGGDMKTTTRKIVLTLSSSNSAKKVFSPVRMKGTNCLKKRVYKSVMHKGKRVSLLNGRAAVVVTDKSPILCCYNTKKECVVVSFYVQRYDINDFAIDLSLQKLIS